METGSVTAFLDQWLGLIIDAGLMVGVFCLWLTWYRNGKRQQHMEQLLMGTAQQLEEATMHLSMATNAIETLKQQAREAAAKQPEAAAPLKTVRQPAPRAAPQPVVPSAVPAAGLPPQNSTQATMILRMQREGETEEAIADRLDIPLAQVKLMLKLHAASGMR